MAKLRTQKTEDRYTRHKKAGGLESGCRLCEAPSLQEFTHWKIVENEFPYDRIAATHHMILPKRHVREEKLSQEELQEYKAIKEQHMGGQYEYLIEPVHKLKSIPDHHHLHLIVAKW